MAPGYSTIDQIFEKFIHDFLILSTNNQVVLFPISDRNSMKTKRRSSIKSIESPKDTSIKLHNQDISTKCHSQQLTPNKIPFTTFDLNDDHETFINNNGDNMNEQVYDEDFED